MSTRPAVLCPVDFSEASRAALVYAATIAEHFGAALIVLTVDDPVLAEVAASTGHGGSLAVDTEAELRRFAGPTLAAVGPTAMTTTFRVAIGRPGHEIVRIAQEVEADLIVMSSHGRSGVRKLFFGSTTERVLRAAAAPVLVTPEDRAHSVSMARLSQHVQRVLAPVDLSPASIHQTRVAAGIASALAVPLTLAHVMEPVHVPESLRAAMPGVESARRTECERRLHELAGSSAPATGTETLIVPGEPSEKIVDLARMRGAHLIVMGLHSSGPFGPRMGSVTYRVLCLTRALVLALPPAPTPHLRRSGEAPAAVVA